MSGNGADGLRVTSAASGSSAEVDVSRSRLIQNAQRQVYGLGVPGGSVFIKASENVLGTTLFPVDGSSAFASVGRNSGEAGIECLNGAHLLTYENNEVLSFGPIGCTTTVSGL